MNPSGHHTITKCRKVAIKILLALLSTLLTLVGVEFAYRVKLSLSERSESTSFVAYSNRYVSFDEELGYRYVPDSDVVGVRVVDGRVVETYERSFNHLGQPAVEKSNCDDAEFQVLVVGDSFSALSHQGVIWSDLLEAGLQKTSDTTVCVRNAAQDGYGIMQMVDRAAECVSGQSYDTIIVAFISDDLNRARIWLTVHDDDGEERVFLSRSPDLNESRAGSETREWDLYDERITKSWVERVTNKPPPNDVVLLELNERYADRTRASLPEVGLFNLSRSYLYQRIVYGSPYFGLSGEQSLPRINIHDFRDDARFVQKVDKLVSSDCKIVLVHLPQFEELQAGRYLLSFQQQSLLHSLEETLGCDAISLFPYIDPQESYEEFFRLPYDGHPSQAGMNLYSDAILKAIVNDPDRDP